jgi:hypothetical protein
LHETLDETEGSTRYGSSHSTPKLGRLVTEIFYYITSKRDGSGLASQVREQSFILRTGLRGRFLTRFQGQNFQHTNFVMLTLITASS